MNWGAIVEPSQRGTLMFVTCLTGAFFLIDKIMKAWKGKHALDAIRKAREEARKQMLQHHGCNPKDSAPFVLQMWCSGITVAMWVNRTYVHEVTEIDRCAKLKQI